MIYNYGSFPSNIGDFTGLPPNSYTVTITDDNFCSVTSSFTITEPSEIITTITPDQTICNGATTTISTTTIGGVPPYTYNWGHTNSNTASVNINPTQLTTYSCYIVDINDCISNTVITTVDVSPPVELTILPDNASVCPGESILITANYSSGNPPYTLTLNGSSINMPYEYYPNTTGSLSFTLTALSLNS